MNEQSIKHLEMIQGIISRLAGNSFLIKGWTITLASASLGFYISSKDHKPQLLILIALTSLIFWVLDSYYLEKERQFRKLYEDVVSKRPKIVSLSMDISKHKDKFHCLLCVMFTFPTVLIYWTIIVSTLIVYYGFK